VRWVANIKTWPTSPSFMMWLKMMCELVKLSNKSGYLRRIWSNPWFKSLHENYFNFYEFKRMSHYTIINLCNYLLFMIISFSKHFEPFEKKLSNENINYVVLKIFLSALYSFHIFHIYFNVPIINKKHCYTSNIFNINLSWHLKTCRIKFWLHLRWVMFLCFPSMFKDILISLLICQASYHYHFHIFFFFHYKKW
jgi:hypothetical protein